MTNLVDIVVDADGTPASGKVVVHWPMFQANGTPVTQGQRAYDIVNGQLNLNLYPTVNALPAGSYYTANFQLNNGSVYDEYWVVPAINTVKLNQVRAMFPPAPGLFVNSNQITGGGAANGQFLGWNGSQWIPMNPTLANFTPNNLVFALGVGSSTDTDLTVAVTGSVPSPPGSVGSVVLGDQLTLNVPDASVSARGVVTTGAQAFGGPKTFQNQTSFNGSVVVNSFAPSNPQPGTIWFDGSQFHLQGSLQIDGGGMLSIDRVAAKHLDLSQATLSETVNNPQHVTFPGKESILLTGVRGIGVDLNGWLWLGSGRAFASLRPDAAWTARWIDLSPYQHPIVEGAEAQPSEASIVLYQDVNSWIGMGVDNAMRIWFRTGPNNGGQYYYLHPDGGSLGVSTWVNNTLVAQRAGINLTAGRFVTLTATDNIAQNTVDVVVNAAGNLVDPTLARGDLLVRGTSIVDRLPAIYDGTYRVLTCDPQHHLGVSWTIGVPTSRRITAGAGLWGGGGLWDDITLGANVLSVFGRTGNIVMSAADIINAGGMVDPMLQRGDLIVRGPFSTVNNGTTRLAPGIAGSVLVCDPAQPLGVYWVPGAEFGAQTPWLQDIDGANYNLTNVGNLQVNLDTVLNGTLAVGGNSMLTGNLAVGGGSVLTGDLAVGGDTVLTGNFAVGGDSELTGFLDVAGDLAIGGDSVLTGDLAVGADLDVAGNGAVAGDFSVGGDITFTGDTVLQGDLAVTGDTSLTGTLDVTGDSALGNIAVTGTSDFTGDMTVTGDTALTGAFDVTGDSTLTGDVAVDGDFSVTGTSALTGNVTMGADLDVTGDASIGGDLVVTGDFHTGGTLINGNLTATGDSDLQGDVVIGGGLEVATIDSGTTTPVQFTPPLEAGQINLNPDVKSWGDVQAALASISDSIDTLSRGMSYVGSYDAANDIATFVPALSALDGPLPAANAAGLQQGDFLIATSDSATIDTGDQLISGGPTGGANWDILPVGHVAVTATMVALSPQIGTWTTVQDALGHIADGDLQTPWLQNISADGYALTSGSTANALVFGTGTTAALTERMRINATGVGIGTNAPAALLHVNGNQIVNNTIYTPAGVSLTLGSGSVTARVTVTTNGDVGVGNTIPSAPFTGTGPILMVGSATASSYGAIVACSNTTTTTAITGTFLFVNYAIAASPRQVAQIACYLDGAINSGTLAIFTSSAGVQAEKMRITSGGNVGIGTTAPTALLHVNGNMIVNNTITSPANLTLAAGTQTFALYIQASNGYVGVGGTATPAAKFTITGVGSAGAPVDSNAAAALLVTSASGTGGQGGEVRFGFGTGITYFYAIKGLGGDGSANTAGDLAFYSRIGSAATSVTEVVRFTSGGYVGIGTTPATPLHVHTAVSAAASAFLPVATLARMPGDPNFRLITFNGDSANLTGNEAARFGLHYVSTNEWNSGIRWLRGATRTDGSMLFDTTGIERMRITAGGSVGIGNAAPAAFSSAPNYTVLQLGPITATGFHGFFVACGNTTGTASPVGAYTFANFAITAAEKRIAEIHAATDGATNSGCLRFYTWNAGVNAQRMRITAAGAVAIGSDGALPFAGAYTILMVGTQSVGGGKGVITASANITTASTEVGFLAFTNYALAASNKAVAIISGTTGALTNSGRLLFYTYNNGTEAERMRIIETGEVGIGTTAPGALGSMLEVNGNIICGPANYSGHAWLRLRAGTAAGNEAYVSFIKSVPAASAQEWQIGLVDATGNYVLWGSNSTNPSTIHWTATPAGRFGIGAPNPTFQLQLSTDSAAKPGTNTWTIISDLRTKRNVQPFDGGIETIRQLEPIVAEYNGMAHMPDGQRVVSLDPAKLKEIVPHAVSGVRGKLHESDAEETEILGVNTHEVFYHMLRAIQQLDQEIRELKGEL